MAKYGGDEEEIVHGINDVCTWRGKSIHPDSSLAWMDCGWSRSLGYLEVLCLKNQPRQ